MKIKEHLIVINSPPQAQGRPRFVMRGKHPVVFDPSKETKLWTKAQAADQFNKRLTCPIEIDVTFYMPIPKSTSKKKRTLMLENKIKHTKTKDVDNLYKHLTDALNGVVYEDDRQIWKALMKKVYGEVARTEVLIRWDEPTTKGTT